MNNFIIIGPPGSGKGSLSKQIEKIFNIHHIATGDLLREKAKQDDEIGKLVSSIINSGNFVSDDLSFKIISEEIKKYPNYILDGFPRTIKQLHMLSKSLENLSDEEERPIAIILQVGQQVVLERIRNRSLQENRADDNSNEVLRVRMTQYIKKTQLVINHYSRLANSIIIDASKTKEQVLEEFNLKYNEIQKKH